MARLARAWAATAPLASSAARASAGVEQLGGGARPRRPGRWRGPRRRRTVAAAEHQVLGPGRADQAGEALGAAAAGDDAEQDLGLTEAGVVAGDAEVAGQGQLAAAAEREPGDGGDDRARDGGDGVERLEERPPISATRSGRLDPRRGVPTPLGELRDVGPGREHLGATGDHHRPGLRLRPASVARRVQLVQQGARTRALTLPWARVRTSTPSAVRSWRINSPLVSSAMAGTLTVARRPNAGRTAAPCPSGAPGPPGRPPPAGAPGRAPRVRRDAGRQHPVEAAGHGDRRRRSGPGRRRTARRGPEGRPHAVHVRRGGGRVTGPALRGGERRGDGPVAGRCTGATVDRRSRVAQRRHAEVRQPRHPPVVEQHVGGGHVPVDDIQVMGPTQRCRHGPPRPAPPRPRPVGRRASRSASEPPVSQVAHDPGHTVLTDPHRPHAPRRRARWPVGPGRGPRARTAARLAGSEPTSRTLTATSRPARRSRPGNTVADPPEPRGAPAAGAAAGTWVGPGPRGAQPGAATVAAPRWDNQRRTSATTRATTNSATAHVAMAAPAASRKCHDTRRPDHHRQLREHAPRSPAPTAPGARPASGRGRRRRDQREHQQGARPS